MGWTLAPGWKMALLVAAAGALALGVNVYMFGAGALEVLSLASAAFIVALGLALLVEPEQTE